MHTAPTNIQVTADSLLFEHLHKVSEKYGCLTSFGQSEPSTKDREEKTEVKNSYPLEGPPAIKRSRVGTKMPHFRLSLLNAPQVK